MGQQIADRRDIEFVLYEQFDAEYLANNERYQGLNRKAFDLILTEARAFAIKELLPIMAEGDRQGVRLEDGTVKVPDCFKKPFAQFIENEWMSLTEDPEMGGQGLPHLIATAATEYLVGPNFAFAGYLGMGHGTGKMIELYGTEAQKSLFVKNLYTCKWAGTMMLTEPEAGSDVGALTTTAVPNEDGSYSITGNKIFITVGDHDLTENIIHAVLARIEGAPAGTAGVSLFIVPKIRVNEDGSLGIPNDVICTGLEEKMGIHGSATCSMALGSKGQCQGFLLGEANKGMRAMFHMMNEARLAVSMQSLGIASTAYLHAANYAKERVQGRDLSDMLNKDAVSVPIVRHPDVRRMLTWMKAYVDGMRSFVYFIADCIEKEENSQDIEEHKRCKGLVDLLTPIIKTYNAKYGFEVCVQAIQTYGGYGYIREYPVEQLLRDAKITSLYEGTDGVQAMDLLARKIGMEQGAVFQSFIKEINNVIDRARKSDALASMADAVDQCLKDLSNLAIAMGTTAMSPDFKIAFAHSVPFLDVFGDMVMAWMLLWRACVAAEKLGEMAKKKDLAFYEGQIKTAQFFCETVLPVTEGRMKSIKNFSPAPLEMDEAAFGG
ncbi:Acyl-CoA dehydrogenase domain protein [Desulfatibacillum aliphaticivorans]|uniref:3-methylmercaptopropionyl-CoA dehydrogenase n=1 Tax=Desulfatibacillum aliphaticivorans TaxID=218208 RepID=B8FLC4_DESAL|nr:acyl-CoA dehydrogenase [Desulfatibacillum aliphaticivorans]ACL05070.1 Acyl-CoA dehydrogenase domain protein [Desulfatibacillum aliphaticivorans]